MTQIRRVAIIGAVALAIGIIVVVAALSQGRIPDETSTASQIGPDQLQEADIKQPKTGAANVLALEIVPQGEKFNKAKQGQIDWLDAAINNVGNNTPVDDVKLKDFQKYVEGQKAPDFDMTFENGTIKYYRIYFTEMP